MVEAATEGGQAVTIELQEVNSLGSDAAAALVSSGERSGVSAKNKGGKRSSKKSKKQRKGQYMEVSQFIPAQRMADDDVEEYAEAMDSIECPHKVQLSIACRSLIDVDGPGDKSDPYAIVYFKAEKDKKWTKLGRTETRTDDLNPDFDKVFDINYKFERNQIIKVEIFDHDDNDPDDFIGNFECELNKILTAHNQTVKGVLTMEQKRKEARGKIFLTAHSV